MTIPKIIAHGANTKKKCIKYMSMNVYAVEIDLRSKSNVFYLSHDPLKTGVFMAYYKRNLFYLDNALSILNNHTNVMIDIKEPLDAYRVARCLMGFRDKIILSGYELKTMLRIKRFYPRAWVFLSMDKEITLNIPHRIDGVSVRHTLLDESIVKDFRKRELKIAAWTVNDHNSAIRMIDLGVDYIITDKPLRLKYVAEDYYYSKILLRGKL